MEPRISITTLGVSDLARSIRFYRDGLGFATKVKEGEDVAFFATTGTRVALYPLQKLAEDIAPRVRPGQGFAGITLAHNVRERKEVAEVLALVAEAGGKIVKPAQDTFGAATAAIFRTRTATTGRWRGRRCFRSIPAARSSCENR